MEPLNTDQATAFFDYDSRLIRVAYRGNLGSGAAEQVYDWIEQLIQTVGIGAIAGEIFDFTAVTSFDPGNLQTARKVSKKLNMTTDTSHLPVAMIIANFYQEEILRSPMRVLPEMERKRIVWSEQEALDFIGWWNAQHTPTE